MSHISNATALRSAVAAAILIGALALGLMVRGASSEQPLGPADDYGTRNVPTVTLDERDDYGTRNVRTLTLDERDDYGTRHGGR